MSYDRYTGASEDEQARVAYFMNLLQQCITRRVNFEAQWEEAAQLCWPEYRNSFTYGHVRAPGMKQTQFQIDTKGSIASHRFMAIADGLITPFSMMWSIIRANNKDLMKVRRVAEYYGKVTAILWEQRYRYEANFIAQNQLNMQGLGVFGNMGMIVDELDTRPGGMPRGLRYMAQSPGEIYLLVNHQGRVDGYVRYFRWTPRQAYQRWGDAIPRAIKSALEKNSLELFDFLQFVLPNHEYRPEMVFTPRQFRWESVYISPIGRTILEESGYRSFPMAYGRYSQAPEEDYGRGPAQMVLPELKTLNAEKGFFLKQGHLAGDPAYLLPGDDGLFDFKAHSGAWIYGGMSSDGKRLVETLPTGQIQVTEEMMKMSADAVDDAFLTRLFAVLWDEKTRNQRNAREVVEDLNDRALFLAPTLGRQFSDYCGPLVEREIDMLAYLRMLPPMPPELREAAGEYKTVYASPLARSLRGQPIAGFMRTLEIAERVAQMAGRDDVFDIFEFEDALPEIADDQFVPVRWMATDKSKKEKAVARARAAKQDADVKSLPGRAAILKAQAISDKAQAGQNIGGTLSGTAAGGMPMMPGQNAPGGRQFGG